MNIPFYKQLLEEERKLIEDLSAVRVLIKRYKPDNEAYQGNIPFKEAEHNTVAIKGDGYDKDWVQEEKVFFALKQINKGTVNDVAKVLNSLDEEYSMKRARTAATNKCSRLYRDGRIGATKVGRKYRYFIKDDE